MRLVKFENEYGNTVYINPEKVVKITPSNVDGVIAIFLDGALSDSGRPITEYVRATSDEVAAALLGQQ